MERSPDFSTISIGTGSKVWLGVILLLQPIPYFLFFFVLGHTIKVPFYFMSLGQWVRSCGCSRQGFAKHFSCIIFELNLVLNHTFAQGIWDGAVLQFCKMTILVVWWLVLLGTNRFGSLDPALPKVHWHYQLPSPPSISLILPNNTRSVAEQLKTTLICLEIFETFSQMHLKFLYFCFRCLPIIMFVKLYNFLKIQTIQNHLK